LCYVKTNRKLTHLPLALFFSLSLEQPVAGNSRGNKVTETIFTGSREIIPQSPELQSMSGFGLNTYRVCPPTPYKLASTNLLAF
jgi:hypothetical protein